MCLSHCVVPGLAAELLMIRSYDHIFLTFIIHKPVDVPVVGIRYKTVGDFFRGDMGGKGRMLTR